MTPVIKVENLEPSEFAGFEGKLYKIGARQERYLTLRDQLANAFTAPFQRLFRNQKAEIRNPKSKIRNALIPHSPAHDGYIWVLKDVSFEVQQGEVSKEHGVFQSSGRNGASKDSICNLQSKMPKWSAPVSTRS